MPKIIPACPERPKTQKVEELSYDISLLTPMFGGGVDAGEPDPLMPFRATAIRGQLQFWWRATVGASCRDVTELLGKHSAVWGSTGKASEVKLVVAPLPAAGARACGAYFRNPAGKWRFRWDAKFQNGQGIPYALFPFAGKQPPGGGNEPEKSPAMFLSGGGFTLRVICPQQFRAGVETALRAWVNFGGMGARTRRGCGSIYCKDLAPNDIKEAIGLVKALIPNPPEGLREWPTLGGPLLVGNESEAITAWSSAIGALQKFRQGVGFARNRDQDGRPVRSLWPEPETIRRITNRHMAKHPRMKTIPDDAFPRAELGLPIIFHFKDAGDGDPADTTLYPPLVGGEKCDRMASPLIIKALGLANGKAVPIVLRLRTPQLDNVRLEGAGEPRQYGPGQLRGARLGEYEKSPMAGTPSGSALDAFINFIQDEDVWGVLK